MYIVVQYMNDEVRLGRVKEKQGASINLKVSKSTNLAAKFSVPPSSNG
jgi:hypothetical protein